MIQNRMYHYSVIDAVDFDFNLCDEKEKFLETLEKSVPKKVEKFHTKGTEYSLKYDNVTSIFNLCINRANLWTSDHIGFSLDAFLEFLEYLAYYDNRPLMCSFHNEGQFSSILTFPYGENSLRISVFNRPEYYNFNCSADIIIKKDTFLAQIKEILEKAVKDTEKLDEGHKNRYVNMIKYTLNILNAYFNNRNEFKEKYEPLKHFRVFDIAYKNLDGVWEFTVCLEDDIEADPDYWEKQKKKAKFWIMTLKSTGQCQLTVGINGIKILTNALD